MKRQEMPQKLKVLIDQASVGTKEDQDRIKAASDQAHDEMLSLTFIRPSMGLEWHRHRMLALLSEHPTV